MPRLTVVPDDGADPVVPDDGADPVVPDDGADPVVPDDGADPVVPDDRADPEARRGDELDGSEPGTPRSDELDGPEPRTPRGGELDGSEPGAAGRPGAHDAAWFEDVVRSHFSAVHRYLVRRAGVGDADDLTADVFVVAWRRRDDMPDEVPLAWLYRTAGFVVANFRRKGRPIPVADVPDEVADDDPAVRPCATSRCARCCCVCRPAIGRSSCSTPGRV